MAELIVTPIVETLANRLFDFLKDETLTILNFKKELEGIERKMRKIMLIIKNAEKKSLNDESIRLWMTDLKDIAYDIDDIIDDCKVRAQVLASTSSGSRIVGIDPPYFSHLKNLQFSYKIGKRVKEINARLEEIAKENEQLHAIAPNFKDQQQSNNAERFIGKTTHFVADDLVGSAKEDAEKLMKLILDKNESSGRTCVNLAILGMGGIGKTTLAQKIFDKVTKSGQFQQKMWICVSKDFKEPDLLKEMVRKAGGNYGHGESLDELTDALEKAVRDKTFFLVLDDVWHANIWEKLLKDPLKSGEKNSKILITTRDVNVARGMSASHFHEVKLLSIKEGWSLLRNNVFTTENEMNSSGYFKDVGVQIVEKCGRLPLAIKSIAGILKTKEKWIGEWEKINCNEVWTQNIFEDNDVMKALYLSYEDLSYQLKQCFVYCSLFPEDYSFRRKDVAELWIAEGFLGDKTTYASVKDLHKELVNRNILQYSHSGDHHKMHDLVRSLGEKLGSGEHFYGNLKNLEKFVRRLSLHDEKSLVYKFPRRLQKKLRTLILFQSSELKQVPTSIFKKLQYLRVLSLSGTGIDTIPDSIKYLLHLRYLNVSHTTVATIPESIGHLKNLQFLLFYRCKFLKKLPKSITNLQNLMSLEYTMSNPTQMPKGMGQMKQLQSIVYSVVENENEAKLGCTMQELQSLNLLAYLSITNLQQNQSLEEVRSVELVEKNHLRKLVIHWKPVEDVSDNDIDRSTEVFEELHPPPCLMDLFIYNFYGHTLPNWMSYSSSSSLNNLLDLTIYGCKQIQRLPEFGKLPQLLDLKIYGASSIQKIGPEFLGRGEKSIGTYFRPFAKLIIMQLVDFSELEEWHWDGAEDDVDGRMTPFPCLLYLFIEKCPKLKSLPDGLRHATSLVKLILNGNKDLERIPELPTVKELFITNCSSLQHAVNLNSLKYVELEDIKLSVIPYWLKSILTSRRKALSLYIRTGELQLLQRLCPWDIGLDWPFVKDIPLVQARLIGQDCKAHTAWDAPDLTFVEYIKSPFSITTNQTSPCPIVYNNPKLIPRIYRMKFATTAQAEVLDVTPLTANQLWNIKQLKQVAERRLSNKKQMKQVVGKKLAKYSKLPFGFHKHLKITTADGRTRITCIHQSYFDEPAFVPFYPFNHTHLPYTTNQGETGMTCLHLKYIHPKGVGSQASSSTS